MSDRIHSLTVVFEDAMHEDGAREIAAAIGIIRGVGSVVPHVADAAYFVAREQAAATLRTMLFEALMPRQK